MAHRLRVLVTGPGGRIGTHILPAFRERYDLRLFDRRPMPDGIVGELADPEALRAAMDGMDAVLHLAAIASERDPQA